MVENIFLAFVIYSFLGWISEVIFAFYKHGKFVNRGFLHGPFCPIYGIGVVLTTSLLDDFKGNIIILFVLSVLITSILEYATGYCLEVFFKSTWWDYSNKKFNIGGKVCLAFSLLWGVACLFIVLAVNPIVNYTIVSFNNFLGVYKTLFLQLIFLYFWTDFIMTLVSLYGFKNILKSIQDIKFKYEEDLAKLRANANISLEELSQLKNDFKLKEEAIFGRVTANQRRLVSSFPNISTKSYKIIGNIKKLINDFEK